MDAMLQALLQADSYVKDEVKVQNRSKLPVWCGGNDFADCVHGLLTKHDKDFQGQLDLFRRKAELVETVQRHMDQLEAPGAKAYMTCRAVVAAKIDFDATDDDRNDHRSEANRRAEQFFRSEASVGME
jgi:hypothetical protein